MPRNLDKKSPLRIPSLDPDQDSINPDPKHYSFLRHFFKYRIHNTAPFYATFFK
jgi:hypothetical protein